MTGTETSWLWLLFIVLPLAWLAIWCSVTWLIGLFGGWSGLARRYHDLGPTPEVWERVPRMWVGRSRYRRTVWIGVSAGGLHLRVPFLFRLGHPPLFIPWGELHEADSGGYLPSGMVRCAVGTPAVTTLTLPEHVFKTEAARRFSANPVV